MTNIILQEPLFDGGYVSELIDGRFQVMESRTARAHVIFDHEQGILIRNKKGDMFETWPDVNAARHFIGAGAIVVKAPRKSKADKPAKAPKVAGEKKPAYVKKGRKESALSYMKELLMSHGNTTDQAIADLVKKKFPDSNYNASMVKFNRKKLAG